MAAEQRRAAVRPARAGLLRRALPAAAKALGTVLACGLWLGVASPSLQLLPGVGLADESIEISLQSAMLGIADGTGRPPSAEALAAAAVLGLSYGELLAMLPADAPSTSGIVRLDRAAELATAPHPQPDDGSAAEPLAQSSQSDALAAADPPPPPPEQPAAEPVAAFVPASAPPPAPRPVAPKPEPVAVTEPALLRTQSVEFESVPRAEPTVGGSYAVAASASSGLPVKLSVAGGRNVCKLAGSTVSFRSTGTCVLVARQAGNLRYAAAEARQNLDIGRAGQSVGFGSAPPSPALVGGAYAVAASASSGLPVVVSASGACSLAGGSVSLDGAGTCRLEAAQHGDDSWAPARAEQSFAVVEPPVVRLAQTVVFSSTAPVGAAFGGPAYTVGAAASSGLPVSLSLAPASAGVCSLSGSTVSFVGAGTCTVRADQAGSSRYLAAPQVQQSFAVAKASQTVAFTSSAPGGAVVGGSAYSVSATASSGLAVAFSLAPSSAGVCTLAGSTVSLVGVGTCTIRADQAGNASYDAAPQAQQSFAVAKAPQTITFTSTPPAGVGVGGPAYTVSATATSGLAVSFSLAPSSAGVCTLAGSTVSLVGAGTCTIRSDQAGDAGYEAAPQAQQSFAVANASQTITFTSTPPVVDGSVFLYHVSATATSGLAVTFSLAPASSGVCALFGSWILFFDDGVCTVRADQAGDASWEPAPQVQQSIVVTGH